MWRAFFVFVLVCGVGIFALAGCATRPVTHADLVGVYNILFSFDTSERITLKADGAAIYESIPLLADAGDTWTGRWEARDGKVILTMAADRGATVDIPLKVIRHRRGIELDFSPKSWSEVFMVLPGEYVK